MTESKPNIVPFGKYKGQPVEVLAQDRPYLEWLSAQDWFRERYAGIYTLIVNNFSEATETPDHNALQVLFLEDEFCERFTTALIPQWREKCARRLEYRAREITESLAKELNRHRQTIDHYANCTSDWQAATRASAIEKVKQIEQYILDLECFEWKLFFGREFERDGVDVKLRGWIDRVNDDQIGTTVVSAHIEIKPSVGDDYPAILRQMRANRSTVLFTERYSGTGATEAQFVRTFALSDLKVVFRRDVEAAKPGPFVGKSNA